MYTQKTTVVIQVKEAPFPPIQIPFFLKNKDNPMSILCMFICSNYTGIHSFLESYFPSTRYNMIVP